MVAIHAKMSTFSPLRKTTIFFNYRVLYIVKKNGSFFLEFFKKTRANHKNSSSTIFICDRMRKSFNS